MKPDPHLIQVQNIHIYPSNLTHESRIFKIAKSLIHHHLVDSICLFGIKDGQTPEFDRLTDRILIWRVPVKQYSIKNRKLHRIVKYCNWIKQIVTNRSCRNVKIVNCHSIFDLVAGVFIKIRTKCLLIYDTHELETERAGTSRAYKIIIKVLEMVLVPFCDQIFTVSDSISNWYKSHYPQKKVLTILNAPSVHIDPMNSQIVSLHSLLKIPDGDLIFLYLGLLSNGRGITIMIDVFSSIPATKHLVIIGYGSLEKSIRARIQNFPNIHFLHAIPSNRILAYAAAADVGIVLTENTCLNHYYCLPNKLYEYFQAGIPCIASNFPELSKFIKHYKCGWKTAVNKESLQKLVNCLSSQKIKNVRKGMRRISDPPSWENEEKKLLAAYATLLNKKGK